VARVSYDVVINAPGTPTRVVKCRDVDDCLEVVQAEGDAAEPGAIINMLAISGRDVVPLGRWAVTSRGLVRGTAYRRNQDEVWANPRVPKLAKDTFAQLAPLGADELEDFGTDQVWTFAYRGAASEGAELLLGHGWKRWGRSTASDIPMRKGKRGGPELQLVERYGTTRVTIVLKP
jgi:hypothetical protein